MLHVLRTVTRSFNEFQAMSFVYKNYFLVAIEDYTLRTVNQKDWIAPFEVFEQTPFAESVRGTILRIPARIIFINPFFSCYHYLHVMYTALTFFNPKRKSKVLNFYHSAEILWSWQIYRNENPHVEHNWWPVHLSSRNERKRKIRFSKVSCSSA